jgi:mannosyltransferase
MGMSLDCESELRAFVLANKLDNCVTFTGVVEDVSIYIGCTDVFVLPYLTEALGIALIEAQLTGLPAIVRRVGGIHDVVDGATGRLVKPQDDADLLNAMEQFVADEEKRQKMGFWARNIAVERFAISSVTKKISINA